MLPVNVEIAAASPVAVIEAEQAALNHIEKKIGQIPEWESATIGSPVLYYAPDMTLSAYEFTVKNKDEDVGFIIVSAKKDWMPVLEYGTGSAPSSYLSYTRQIAIDEEYISENDSFKPYIFYWGACTYSMQVGNKMIKDGIVINLASGKNDILPKETPILQMDSQKAKEAWAEISARVDNKSIISEILSYISPSTAMAAIDNGILYEIDINRSLTAVTISGVPTYYQSHVPWFHGDDHDSDAAEYPDCVGNADDPWANYDGCSNISGAMVIAYWYSQGYTSLPNPVYQETEEILIDHCHGKMGTDINGLTDLDNIAVGMQDVINEVYEYDFDTFEEFNPPWWRITGEINAGRPFVLSMGSSSSLVGHSVCAYGYEDDGEDSIRAYSTTNTDQNYYITWGDWTYAAISSVHP
jgi:hypothetical protein